MNISPISYNSSYRRKLPVFRSASGDFGKAVNDFFQKQQITAEIEASLISKFKLAFKDIMSQKNFMGSGFFGKVYQIDENFALKVRNFAKWDDLSVKKGKDVFKNLKTYYGEEVLQIGNFSILKNLGKHIPAGIPSYVAQIEEDAEFYYQTEYLPLFARVPQESYDAIAYDFAELNKMKHSDGEFYSFDSKNPGNVVLSGDKLKLVDSMNSINMASPNSAGKLIELLLSKLSSLRKVESYGDNVEDAKEILRKIIIAAERAELPHDTRNQDRIIWSGAFARTGIDIEPDDFIQNLEVIRAKNPKLSKRLPKAEKYINETINPVFRGKSRELEAVLDNAAGKSLILENEKQVIIEKIKAALFNVLKPSRFIEEGSHKAVYKITSKYAARVPVDSQLTRENVGEPFKWGENKFKEMRNYFGEPVLESGKFQILRNLGAHRPAGVPEHLAKRFSRGQINKYYIERYLPKFAQISQYSYNELANDLAKLNEMKFGQRLYGVFDSLNPNNIVTSNGKLFLVDEIDILCDKSYANTTAKLLNVFINRASKDYEAPDAGKKVNLVRKIFKKTLISGVCANLLHADSKEDFRSWEIALKKCRITTPAYEILNKLEDITNSNLSNNEKTELVKYYLTVLFGRNPTNK